MTFMGKVKSVQGLAEIVLNVTFLGLRCISLQSPLGLLDGLGGGLLVLVPECRQKSAGDGEQDAGNS